MKSLELKKAENLLKKINIIEPSIIQMTDQQFKKKTQEFKKRIEKGENIDNMIVETFAIVREATFRVLNKRLFDVQIIGGLILHFGSIAEMKTGEGKTITSIAPVYLNALTGKGVIVATVNEYLNNRDADEVAKVHNFLGLTVGINKKEMSEEQKRLAYMRDITYSTHSEIGFDYLKDNMVSKIEEKVQRKFNYGIIDEVDSILIDEAINPLIITGEKPVFYQQYISADAFVKGIKNEDYNVDLESKSITLTHKGIDKANIFFGVDNLHDFENSELVHRVQNALIANYIIKLNADYIVSDNKIELIDTFTGRIMDGRSYSDGLQQSIQAKEKLEIADETQTLSTITYQNLFRMFTKLSGMTGTAKTEENEFIDVYNMRVVEIPTNKPIIRKDIRDYIYVSEEVKYKSIVKQIKKIHTKGQPILVGTSLVEQSEKISNMLKIDNIPHQVLNAKQNKSEARIIAKAGQKYSITIATNMAGRGTDIKLTPETTKLGGLYVLGTDKSESRRIDNQLRGRSGRQGDAGITNFFISLDDTLISRFSAQKKLQKTFKSFGDQPIASKYMFKVLERAQKKIEGFNYDVRKNILQYDDVFRQQRNAIYNQRDIIISQKNLINIIEKMFKSVAKEVVSFEQFFENGDLSIDKLIDSLNITWFKDVKFKLEKSIFKKLDISEIIDLIFKQLLANYNLIRAEYIDSAGEESVYELERKIIIKTLDLNWRLHIDQMDKLRSSSSMYTYAQKNPLQVFTGKGAELFGGFLTRVSHNITKALMKKRI